MTSGPSFVSQEASNAVHRPANESQDVSAVQESAARGRGVSLDTVTERPEKFKRDFIGFKVHVLSEKS